jgi:hypothetical protein
MTPLKMDIPYNLLERLTPLQKKEMLLLLQEKHLRENKVAQLSRFNFVTQNHITHKYRKLNFEKREFLLDLYNDTAQKIIVKKAVQVGVSEWALCDALYMCMEMGLSGAYILTKSRLRDDFVAERINPVLREVPYYNSQVGETNNLGIKQLGRGVLRFLGSNSESEFISFPADFMIIDEVDRCDQQNLALVPDRLQASEYKFQRWISNPTVEGLGIDEMYLQSDQKEWVIQCTNCKEPLILDWFTHVVKEHGNGFYIPIDTEFAEGKKKKLDMFCHMCSHVISRHDKGMWVPRNPISLVSGYTISQLHSPTVELADMWGDFSESLLNDTKLQVFWNNKLGLAYKAIGAKITGEMLKECEQQYGLPESYSGNSPVHAGVDVGNVLNVIIRVKEDGIRKLLYADTIDNFSTLADLISRYNIETLVIDMYPEVRKCKEFQENFKDIVWLADYHRGSTMDEVTYNDKLQYVRADRTACIDGVIEDIRKHRIALPYNSLYLCGKEYYEQLCSSTRIKDTNSDKFRWISSKPDHFLHAEVYCRLANKEKGSIDVHTSDYKSTVHPLTKEIILSTQFSMRNNGIEQFFYSD